MQKVLVDDSFYFLLVLLNRTADHSVGLFEEFFEFIVDFFFRVLIVFELDLVVPVRVDHFLVALEVYLKIVYPVVEKRIDVEL